MNEIVSFTKKIEFKTLIYEITSISLEHTLMSYDDETIKGDLIVRGTYKQMIASQIDNPFNYKIPIDIAIDSKYDISDMTIDIDNFTYEVKEENILQLNIDLILDKLKLKVIKEQNEDEDKAKDEDVLIKLDDLFKEEETKEKLEFDPPKKIRSIEEETDEEEKKEEKQKENVRNEDIDNEKKEEKEEIKETREALKEETHNERNEKQEERVEENNKKEIKDSKKEIEEKENKLDRNEKENDKTTEETTEEVMDTDEKQSSGKESLFAKLDTTSETYKTYSIYIVREEDSLDEIMKKYNVKRENLEEYNNLSEVKKGTKLIIPCNNE